MNNMEANSPAVAYSIYAAEYGRSFDHVAGVDFWIGWLISFYLSRSSKPN